MTTVMGKESISKQMEHTTMEIGKMTSTRVKVKSYGPMERFSKVSIAMERNMVEGASTGQMVAHLTVTLSIIKCLVMVSISGQILGSTMENGKKICNTDKDTSNGQMGGNIVESTLRISARVTESFLGLMAVSIQACGTKAANTAKVYTEIPKEKLRKEYGRKVSAKVTGLPISLKKALNEPSH